jgi:hypothetical protein
MRRDTKDFSHYAVMSLRTLYKERIIIAFCSLWFCLMKHRARSMWFRGMCEVSSPWCAVLTARRDTNCLFLRTWQSVIRSCHCGQDGHCGGDLWNEDASCISSTPNPHRGHYKRTSALNCITFYTVTQRLQKIVRNLECRLGMWHFHIPLIFLYIRYRLLDFLFTFRGSEWGYDIVVMNTITVITAALPSQFSLTTYLSRNTQRRSSQSKRCGNSNN